MAVGSGVDVDGGVVVVVLTSTSGLSEGELVVVLAVVLVVVLTSTPALSEGDLVVVPVWPSQKC